MSRIVLLTAPSQNIFMHFSVTKGNYYCTVLWEYFMGVFYGSILLHCYKDLNKRIHMMKITWCPFLKIFF